MNKIQIPWEDRPVGCTDVMWRYSQNPVIGRYHIPSSNSIFNSAVVPFEDGFAGVFRCDNKAVQMNIFAGFSKDGIHWDINHEPIQFKAGNTEMIESEYKYDPRVTWIEDRYWVTWCNGYHGPTIGIAYTFDFKEFFQCENAFLPFNRNGVLFPQKIDGKYAMLSRPSDNGHTPFGDIYISYSPDMKYWGEHRCVMKVTPFPESAWQCTKIGAGSVPFLTDEGWLLFYHGVITTCNGFRYAMGAAILDKDHPEKVLYRTREYLLGPAAPYELQGDVPNVVFPCAALQDGERVAVYYGAADTVVGMAFGYIKEIIDFTKRTSIILTSLIVKSMSHLMADYHADCTVVHSIVRIHIKERRLQDSCREADFIGSRVIISVHCLRSHQPFILVYRFAGFGNHFVIIPFVGTLDICPVRIIFDLQCGVIFPFIRITYFYMEGCQFLQRFFLGLFTHPFQTFDTFSQRSLQVLHQCNHTFFGSSREVLLYIHLSYHFAKYTIYGAHGTFPARLHFFLSRHCSAVEIEVLCFKIIA